METEVVLLPVELNPLKLLEKLLVIQLVKKYLAIYITTRESQ
jgi:hypothetical protein